MVKKHRICAGLMVLSIMFSILSMHVSAAEKECFVSYDAASGEIQYIYCMSTKEYDSVYSPPGEGDLEAIETAYKQINEKRLEQNTDSNVIMPYSIIGSDERTKVGAEICTPYSRICFLEMTWADGHVERGTGWLYSRDRVATAGHCVYSQEHGWADSIRVQPGRYGDYAPFGETWSLQMLTSNNWINNADSAYDYAFLRLRDPIGDICGFFGYSANSGYVGAKVNIAGYPGDKNPWDSGEQWQWQMSGRLTIVTTKNLYYLIDTAAGQSGAPIYYPGNNIAIGIHTTGGTLSNHGSRLTAAMVECKQTW